ncbi:MAG: sugar transferase, partial [Rhodobacteraceae bacterium]|nr:sugar transferase [Paracoccaceae bacterium]NVK17044.1 sugar transferase [Paracoccaceae bacterium]
NGISYQERVALDVAYLRRRSFPADLKIIARTGLAVLGATGR